MTGGNRGTDDGERRNRQAVRRCSVVRAAGSLADYRGGALWLRRNARVATWLVGAALTLLLPAHVLLPFGVKC